MNFINYQKIIILKSLFIMSLNKHYLYIYRIYVQYICEVGFGAGYRIGRGYVKIFGGYVKIQEQKNRVYP